MKCSTLNGSCAVLYIGRRKDGRPLFPFGLFLLRETMLDLVATQPGSAFTSSLAPSTAAMSVPSATTARVGGGVGVGEKVLLPPKNQPSHDFGADSGWSSGSWSSFPLLTVGGGGAGCKHSTTPGIVEGGGVGLRLLIRAFDFWPLSSTQNDCDEKTTFRSLASSRPWLSREPFSADRGVLGRED